MSHRLCVVSLVACLLAMKPSDKQVARAQTPETDQLLTESNGGQLSRVASAQPTYLRAVSQSEAGYVLNSRGVPRPASQQERLSKARWNTVSRSADPRNVRLVSADEAVADSEFVEPTVKIEADLTRDSCSSCDGPCCFTAPLCSADCGSTWFQADYLHWWTDGTDIPPLITTSPDGTPQNVAGIIGQPTTSILLGNTELLDDDRSGGQFSLGYWQPADNLGFEASFLFLERQSSRFEVNSQGDPVIARPFFNVETGLDDAELIAFTDLVTGSVQVNSATEFDSVEVRFRKSLLQQCGMRLDSIGGYRFGRLEDELVISQSTQATGGAAQGSSTALSDEFRTENDFHGAEVGTIMLHQRGCLSLEILGKLAFGNTRSQISVNGSTTVTDVTGDSVTSPEGFLARSTNIGRVHRNDFSVIPEVGVNAGLALSCQWRATLGYRFVYWSRVARAGDQVDLDLNLSDPFSGTRRPSIPFRWTDFWAQGINLGLEYRY